MEIRTSRRPVIAATAADPRKNATKPLFLYLAFTAAHTPYQATPEYLEKFKHIADETRRAYAGQIACMDDEIGKTLAALEKKGMRKDTLGRSHPPSTPR